MIRVADYIAQALVAQGTQHVFLVTGGGAMHLNDAIGRCQGLEYICCHHEQACTMAAEAYARVSGRLGVVNVTTGPGAINALNGVFGAYTDSIPMFVVSGQVKRETCMTHYGLTDLRQLGDQEVDIVRMVGPITKYAVQITAPETVRYEVEKALAIAMEGRPGPVWIDVPVDVQAAKIDPEALRAYEPEPVPDTLSEAQVKEVFERLREAKRPVILVGSGVRLAGAAGLLDRLARELEIPVATAWTAVDILPSDHACFAGRPGVVGDRAGNFAVQNADVVLILGCRLAIRQISYNWESFARHGFKIQVDADGAELKKPTVQPDMPVVSDCGVFLERLLATAAAEPKPEDAALAARRNWLAWCKERVARYPTVQEKHRDPNKPLNPYHFVEILFSLLEENDVVACGDGAASVVPFQAAPVKRGQRLFTNAGSASMGYDVPAAIGAAVAGVSRRTICLAGDGSLQMNIQELQTIRHHGWNLKLFVLNNGGYQSIRSTQQNFFGLLVGEGPESGVSFPDPVRVGEAYGIPGMRFERHTPVEELRAFLEACGPGLCEVMLDPGQPIEPKLGSRQLPDGSMVSSPMEDLSPLLSREELAANMLVSD